MRVLHVIAQKPGQTGSGIYLLNLIRVAAQRGHAQCLVAGIACGDGDYSQVLPESLNFIPVVFATGDLPFALPGMSDEMPYPSTRYRQMTDEMLSLWKKAFTRALKQAAYFQPNLVIVHHLWLLATLVREHFSFCPVIAACHGTEFRQLVRADRFGDEVVAGCRQINRVLALTNEQKQTIQSLYGIDGEKIIVTGSGYNRDLFYPPSYKALDGQVKALYAGKLSAAKGVPSLLRSVAQLPVAQSELQLILAGSGSGQEYEEIRSLAKACHIETIFTGHLPQDELGQLMRDCHLFILPSFYEGLSLVTLEALASGLWIVSSELPGMHEWADPRLAETGVIEYVPLPRLRAGGVPIKEELPSFEKNLAYGIYNQIERVKMYEGEPARGWSEVVNKYSWEAVFNKIENIYHELRSDKNI